MGYKMKKAYNHCCGQMENLLREGDLTIRYNSKYREYGIDYKNEGSYQIINYCPWCGSELPKSLRDLWFEIIDALGVEPEGDIPKSMQSDAWWLDGDHLLQD